MKRFLLLFIGILLCLPTIVNASDVKKDWEFSYEGNSTDLFNKVIETSDNNYLVAGTTNSTDIDGITKIGNKDILITKLDSSGNIIWNKNFGVAGGTAGFNDIFKTLDNSYIISASIQLKAGEVYQYDVLIIKIDENGNLLWSKTIGSNRQEQIYKIIELDDGNLILVGYYSSTTLGELKNNGGNDLFIIKMDKDGNITIQLSYGGNKNEYYSSLIQSSDGDFVLIGFTRSTECNGLVSNGGDDGFIIKFDENLNIKWQQIFGGSKTDQFSGILETANAEFIVKGVFNSTDIPDLKNKGGNDYFLLKYDNKGNIVWKFRYGGSKNDTFSTMTLTSSNDLIISGQTNSPDIDGLYSSNDTDTLLIKVDKNGKLVWQNSYDGISSNFSSVIEDKDGNILAQGSNNSTVLFDSEGNLLKYEAGSTDSQNSQKKYFLNSVKGYFEIAPKTVVTGKGTSDSLLTKYSYVYDFNFNKLENGSATAVQEGEKVIIKTNPKEGFIVEKVVVKDSDGNEISIKKVTSNEYEVELYDDYNITVTFAKDYKLSLNNAENGTFTVEKINPYTAKLLVKPNNGFTIDDIVIKNSNGKELVYEYKDGYYLFNLDDDVTISVNFKEGRKEVVKGEEIENPQTADAFIYYGCAVVSSLFGIWSVEQYRKYKNYF